MFEGLHKRASTHTLRPDEAGGFYEIKSSLHGLREFFNYTTGFSQNKDFGVSLYLGGDKPNFSGNTSKFGSDGHVLVVKKNDDCYLIGPEQTAPGSRPANGLTANQDPTFGLADTHSVLGNADQYTLAGSVYFDNLIYRLKLFNETKTLPPIKYNGMKVVINNDNFQSFKRFFDKLSAETSEVALEKMLTSKPVMFSDTAAKVSARKFVSQITDKDLEALFKQLRSVQHACAVENADSESPIAIMCKVLLEAIKEMKLDSPECYQQTTEFARINNIATQIEKHHNKMRMPQNNDSLLPELVVIAMMAGLVTAVCLFSAPVGYIFLAAAVITFTYLLMTNYQQASESLHMSLAIG